MNLDCALTDVIRRDFGALWHCKQFGNTLEITTPYFLPDSTLLSIFITKRDERYIVCEGGRVSESIELHCSIASEDAPQVIHEVARSFRMHVGRKDGRPLFFKECSDPKLISSVVFDVCSFSATACSTLAHAPNPRIEIESEQRFKTRANTFLNTVKPPHLELTSGQIEELPGIRFSALLKSPSKLWIVQYVTGSSNSYFRKSINDTTMSFHCARVSAINPLIVRTIPFVDTEAAGYDEPKLRWWLHELDKTSKESMVLWSKRETLASYLADAAA